jgi:hypothetical protein
MQAEVLACGSARIVSRMAKSSAAYLKFLHHKRQIPFRNFK